MASYNDPAHPMLVLFAHDGDNAWSGGYSYWYENVSSFSHAAVGQGYEPTVVAEYLRGPSRATRPTSSTSRTAAG